VNQEGIPSAIDLKLGGYLWNLTQARCCNPNNVKTGRGTPKHIGQTLHRKTSAISDRHPMFATGSQRRRQFISSNVLGCSRISLRHHVDVPFTPSVSTISVNAKRLQYRVGDNPIITHFRAAILPRSCRPLRDGVKDTTVACQQRWRSGPALGAGRFKTTIPHDRRAKHGTPARCP
jgi:hypothetical protein